MVQAGSIGLLKAIRKYNPNLGVKLCTYAWWSIHNAIIKEIQKLRYRKQEKLYNFEYPQQEKLLEISDKEPHWELLPDTLTDLENKILELRFENYTFQEIADRLNCTKSVVRNKLESAMEKLRQSET